ncbi:5521_t:CDS:2 [Acaulospora colombiana]|uniref:5521_t:CDS:1 n=1 Tax=Acaulospora colombiana TaxID=27376 RepID=A0ACA9L7P9_9GLOM|nr:5521_t:CDS:2 [Acaulospora colombiana]
MEQILIANAFFTTQVVLDGNAGYMSILKGAKKWVEHLRKALDKVQDAKCRYIWNGSLLTGNVEPDGTCKGPGVIDDCRPVPSALIVSLERRGGTIRNDETQDSTEHRQEGGLDR